MSAKLCPQCGAAFGEEMRFCPTDGSALRAPSGELIGQVVADRYLVERLLGEGGMGRVYLAEHVRMGRKSALKVMSAATMHDADAIGRFNREAANASRISHPNVAAVYDFGETPDGLIYLAMEFVDGEPLTNLLDREGALAPERVAGIVRQIADALEAAHELGIVHRDLKPDNVMIARARDGGALVKVVDFGIAKAPGASAQAVTRTGLVVGTPEYMSPEQISGDALDARSDIYALGLVTFALLTGVLPFPSKTLPEGLLLRLTDRPRTLEEARPTGRWPAALQRVMDRALARKREERFQRVGELAAELSAAVEGSGERQAGMPEGVMVAAPTDLITRQLPPTRKSRESTPEVPSRRAPSRGIGARVMMLSALPVVIVVTLIALRGAPSPNNGAAPPYPLPPRDSAALASLASVSAPLVPEPVTTPPAEESKSVEPGENGRRSDHRDSGLGTRDSALATSTRPPRRISSPESRVPMNARQAARALDQAQSLIDKGQPQRALFLLQGALARLPTRSDSVRAMYHVAEALLKQGQTRRGCELLQGISSDPSGGYARSAASLYDSQCS